MGKKGREALPAPPLAEMPGASPERNATTHKEDIMARTLAPTIRFGVDHALKLYGRFLDICPEAIWQKKFGGWLVSQQYYHALAASGAFLSSITGKALADPCPGTGDLRQANLPAPSMENARTLLATVTGAADDIFKNIDDETLLSRNDRLSLLLESDVNNAECLELLASHLLYHLGSCDAALREDGREGAF